MKTMPKLDEAHVEPVKGHRNCFYVRSFSGTTLCYWVSLEDEDGPASCECPHFQKRLKGTGQVCKHVWTARKWLFNRSLAKARSMTIEDLSTYLLFHPDVHLSIRMGIEQAMKEKTEPAECMASYR
jgi:uncharacterized C2H2 Zn-finger protein